MMIARPWWRHPMLRLVATACEEASCRHMGLVSMFRASRAGFLGATPGTLESIELHVARVLLQSRSKVSSGHALERHPSLFVDRDVQSSVGSAYLVGQIVPRDFLFDLLMTECPPERRAHRRRQVVTDKGYREREER